MIKDTKICGISDLKTLKFIVNHPHPPKFIGFITNYKFEDKGPQGTIKIALKYNPRTNLSAIEKIVRVSKPGLRKYVGFDNLPRVINGLGVAILSTSKGVITDKEARKMKIGGEVLCYVY